MARVISYCSFCDKAQDDVPVLIARDPVFICSECVVLCVQLLADRLRPKGQPDLIAKINKWQDGEGA